MKKMFILFGVIAIIAMIASVPISEAQLVNNLPSFLVAALAVIGIKVVIVGSAVIVSSYVIYRASSSVYSYFTAYSYTTVSAHAYDVHAADFPNIWSTKPPRSAFDSKCKDNMNSKSMQKYIQKSDKRLLSYNPTTKMISVGDTDGKTVITCFPKTQADVDKKVRSGEWIKVTK